MDMEVKWKWKCYGLTTTDHGNGNGIGKWKMLMKDGTMEMKNEMKWKTCRQCFAYSVNHSMDLGIGNDAKVNEKYSLLVMAICGLVIMQDG